MFSWPPSRFGGRRAGESPREVDKMIWKRRARELVTERLGMPLSAGAGAEVYEDPLVPTMRAVKLKDRRTFLVNVSESDPMVAVEQVDFKSWPPKSDGRPFRWSAIGALARK